MSATRTEEASDAYRDLDTWPSDRILTAIVDAQRASIDAVREAIPSLAIAAEAVAARIRAGGRLVYVGAGSPALMAQADALELPGTYGLAPATVPVLAAGGQAAMLAIPSGAEDDRAEAEAGIDALGVGPGDAVLAISASGTTPFPVAALRRAKARGALAIGMASNANTPLLDDADIAVLLPTPPEVIAGSTRMNAGTAQKCALNMLSTLVGIRLGHVHDNLMVNVQVENEKLRRRAIGIIMRIVGTGEPAARAALERCDGSVKAAILVAAGAGDVDEANDVLARHGGAVRACLSALASRNG
jgi:N-acetylmuramic acid 6-phosphate etherase